MTQSSGYYYPGHKGYEAQSRAESNVGADPGFGTPDVMSAHTPEYYDRGRNRASTVGHDTTAEIAAYLERRTALTEDSAARKDMPIASGVMFYFPNALAEVARISKLGNDKHNPGQPLHHARGKSTDHADCIARHLLEAGTVGSDGIRHSAALAWRALALLQEELEHEGAPLARGARLP